MECLQLTQWPIPQGETEDEVRKSPVFCDSCWNLYPPAANTAAFTPNVHTISGNRQEEAVRRALGESYDHAAYERSLIEHTPFNFDLRLVDLRDAILKGCNSCLMLKTMVSKLSKAPINHDDNQLRLSITMCKGDALRISFRRETGPEADQALLFGFDHESDGGEDYTSEHIASWELYTLPASPSPWPTIGSSMTREYPFDNKYPMIGGTVRSISAGDQRDGLFDTVREWIASCSEEHSLCKQIQSATEKPLPTRVLVVSESKGNYGTRLVESRELENLNEPYVALSHCWGKGNHIVTTTATLSERRDNIPLACLSKTFRDAVEITARLGFKYLWIDSLCIVQDDPKDVQVEIATMASIYSNAALVIAASSSTDGNGGCLYSRKGSEVINGTTPTGEPFTIYGREVLDHAVFGWDTAWSSDWILSANPVNMDTMLETHFASHPLMSRAWCFQERVLAVRMLHLTKDEAVFECATGMSCECGALQDYQQDELHGPRQTLLGSRPNTDVHYVWRDLAMKYSQKSITHKTDGLRALTGIATKWSSTFTGRYLAGLWEKDILNHLRWVPLKEDAGEQTRYVTPSWSWISVHRPVRWAINERPGLEYYVEVDMSKSECHSSELNPFGDLTCGYLHLTGKVASVTLSLDKHDRPCIEKSGVQPRDLFRQFDSLSRCRQAQGADVLCLLFCNKGLRRPNQTDQYSALVVGKAVGEDLSRQPQHVQAFGHVYQRLGILDRLQTECWDNAQRISMYLI